MRGGVRQDNLWQRGKATKARDDADAALYTALGTMLDVVNAQLHPVEEPSRRWWSWRPRRRTVTSAPAAAVESAGLAPVAGEQASADLPAGTVRALPAGNASTASPRSPARPGGLSHGHGIMARMTNLDYPTAVTAPSQQDPKAIASAIAWVRGQLAPGQQALVWTPSKPALTGHPMLAKFALEQVGVTSRTRRTVSWSGGPVLAGWPDTDALDELADDRRVSALCVIPHGTMNEVGAWAARTGAAVLGEAVQLPAAARLDPVVEVGLSALTGMVNHANNLAGTLDKRDAVNVLTVLHRGGYGLEPTAVYDWALAHGWRVGGAQRLRELCQRLTTGHTLRAGAPSVLRADVLDQWREDAAARAGEAAPS